MNRPSIAVLLSIAALTATSGCSSQEAAVPTSDPVVIVAGSHANAPAPTLTAAAMRVLDPAIETNKVLGVVIADSTPALVPARLKDVHGTPAGRANLVKANHRIITRTMATPPDSNGADTFEAIAVAAGLLKGSSKSATGTIVVSASALDDTGVMAMTQDNLLGANPSDLVKARHDALSAIDLTGITVVMTGTGYTAAPQQPLDAQRRSQLAGLWSATLKASGATVVIDSSAVSGAPVSTRRTVTPIPVATAQTRVRIASCTTTDIVYDQSSAVSFVPDEAVFLNDKTAKATLREGASWLAAKPGRQAVLVGTTADDGSPQAGQIRLSQKRAQAVADVLTAGGVRPSQLTVSGVGSRFPQYVADRNADGTLDPARAVRNRSVRLTFSEIC